MQTLTGSASVGGAFGPRSTSAPAGAFDAAERLVRGLGPGPFAQICLFAAPDADLSVICTRVGLAHPRTAICGCTTAGEITAAGYDDGQIVAFALPVDEFDVETLVFEGLDRIEPRLVVTDLVRARQSLARRAGHLVHECALLLVDGLSGQEDALVAALSGGLGSVPVVGGSAGDGGAFRATFVYAAGRLLQNAAVLMLVRSAGAVRPFSLDNLRPTADCMVVTQADPEHRLVIRINDEPAAEEYARLLETTTDRLSPFVFAAHPILVRAGGRYHVRAVQDVREDGTLVFFAAIDEGLVLTIAAPCDMALHLDTELAALGRGGAPSAILGFDCLFRRIDATGRQRAREVSDILSRHRVTGFSTYGEQIGAMHVNQTLTGIAFYPPQTAPEGCVP